MNILASLIVVIGLSFGSNDLNKVGVVDGGEGRLVGVVDGGEGRLVGVVDGGEGKVGVVDGGEGRFQFIK